MSKAVRVASLLAVSAVCWAQTNQQSPVKPDFTPAEIQRAQKELQSIPPPPDVPVLSGAISASTLDSDIVLPPAGIQAVQLANKVLYGEQPAALNQDGWITYTYGHGIPIVILQPLHLTAILLGKGEVINPQILPGDPRIHCFARVMGSGAGAQSIVFLKPQDAGYATDVAFTSNLHAYTIRVFVKPHDYTPRATFRYPEDDSRRQREQDAAIERLNQEREQAQLEAAAEKRAHEELLARLDTTRPVRNTNYEVKLHGKAAVFMRPAAIWDDGIRTTIQLPADAAVHDLPIPKIYNAKGQDSPNYRWKQEAGGQKLIIDAIFMRCELLSGVGKHQQRVLITNNGLKPEKPNATEIATNAVR